MPKSMTAFGRSRIISQDGDRTLTAEIKSVNSRYMDCTVKLPRMFSQFEEKIKAYLAANGVTRGKIEVYIGVEVLETRECEVMLDRAAAASYISALKALRDEFSLADDISVMRVAENRELFIRKSAEENAERDWEDISAALEPAVAMFLEGREAEGQRLIHDITEKLNGISAMAEKVKKCSEADIKGYNTKLVERIKRFLADFDAEAAEQRILTEAAIFADKAAIDEELVRLSSHFSTFIEITRAPEPAGRKLDFLMQEINREVNTIGSKSADAEIARLVVEMKAELEKIREQVQNIE